MRESTLPDLVPHQWIVQRLFEFVQTVGRDSGVREQLARAPEAALRQCGLLPAFSSMEVLQAPLSVPPQGISATIDAATLLGPEEWRAIPCAKDYPQRTELRLLLAGAKPLCLIHGPEGELVGLGAYLRERGYTALLTPYQFDPLPSEGIGTYSNLMSAPGPAVAGSGQWRGLLVSADCQTACLAWLSLLFEWSHLLGALLGYPTCCVNAFNQRWPTAQRRYGGDPGIMLLAAQERAYIENVSWASNIFARYAGYELVQHFPCALDCGETERLAQRHATALQHFWPEACAALLSRIAAPVLVCPGHGITLFPTARIDTAGDGVQMSYAPSDVVHANPESALSRAIDSTSAMSTDANGAWRISTTAWSGWLLNFSGRT